MLISEELKPEDMYPRECGVSAGVDDWHLRPDGLDRKATRPPERSSNSCESSQELEAIYENRFNAHVSYRRRVWRVLVRNFFSQFVSEDGALLDLGCGYGEFINNVQCRKRYGMDLNSRSQEYLEPDVAFLLQDCSTSWSLPDGSLDLVFTSNFFEHLPSKSALQQTLTETWRCLKPGGRLIAMGPNIRFVGGAYWDFWDHYLALTECSLAEAMRIRGFRIERLVDRFLPYTMVNQRKIPSALISLYLKIPFMWRALGKQFLVIARKPC